MKWDLKRPCKHCPFNKGSDVRITFRNRARAEEIEETAYRNGFVCHEHATYIESNDETGEPGGYTFGPDGEQHCAGALLMYLHGGGGGNVPFEWLDADEQQRIEDRLDWSAVVFENEEEFLCSQDDRQEHMRGQFRRKSTG